MIGAGLYALALLVALCVQTMQTPLAGAWLLFHLGSCAYLYRRFAPRPRLWWLTLAWLATLGLSAFIIAPIVNGAAWMWVLAAMPLLALCIDQANMKNYLRVSLTVLSVYAIGLILQAIFDVHYTNINYPMAWRRGQAVAWPMLDPNNAAAVLNFGLIPCFYLALRRPIWGGAFLVFAIALMATASKAGLIVAILACAILALERFGSIALFLGALPSLFVLDLAMPLLKRSFEQRFPIWEACMTLLGMRPLLGLGLGSFGVYYQQIRTETYTGGWFAHNDILQFAIELGVPATMVFIILVVGAAVTTTRSNIVSGCVLMAVFLQAMIEFQFYVPVISILAGLALGYHLLAYEQKDDKPFWHPRRLLR